MALVRHMLATLTLVAAGCGDSRPTSAQLPLSPPGTDPPATGGPAAQPNAPPVDATMAYWNGMNGLPAQIAQHQKDGPKAHVWALRDAVRVIRENPTLGIDADLVAWALRMADLLEQRADLIEQSRSPVLLAEAFVRGMSGDPFGVAIELNQTERAWIASARAHQQAWHRLRATLTQRYGVEFR